ncbi:predicted protein [Postia placenta Mad-698-R]|nr:predicted protein [Postia placenta Mad-698-R]
MSSLIHEQIYRRHTWRHFDFFMQAVIHPIHKEAPEDNHTKMRAYTYAPSENHEQIVEETMWLQGALFGDILYGVELTLFLICVKLVLRQFNRHDYKRPASLLILITVLFILGTLTTLSNMAMTQKSFINNRNYPGGPSTYEVDMYSIPMSEFGIISWTIGNWLMDALLEFLQFLCGL